jgi:hypothetical protein
MRYRVDDDWNKPRDVSPTKNTEALAEESLSPERHKGKRKKEPVEDGSAVHSLACAFHSAYRG